MSDDFKCLKSVWMTIMNLYKMPYVLYIAKQPHIIDKMMEQLKAILRHVIFRLQIKPKHKKSRSFHDVTVFDKQNGMQNR